MKWHAIAMNMQNLHLHPYHHLRKFFALLFSCQAAANVRSNCQSMYTLEDQPWQTGANLSCGKCCTAEHSILNDVVADIFVWKLFQITGQLRQA